MVSNNFKTTLAKPKRFSSQTSFSDYLMQAIKLSSIFTSVILDLKKIEAQKLPQWKISQTENLRFSLMLNKQRAIKIAQ